MKLFFRIIFLLYVLHKGHAKVDSLNVLIVLPNVDYSQFKETSKLVFELAATGHKVTLVSPFPPKNNNVSHISISSIVAPIKEYRDVFLTTENTWNSYWSKLKFAKEIGFLYSKIILENTNVKTLLTSDNTFDVVIVEDVGADALAVLSQIFSCPLVVLLSEPLSLFYENYVIDNIKWKEYNDLRTAHHWALKELYRDWIVLPAQSALLKDILPEVPNLRKIMYRTSLVLMPSYPNFGNLLPRYNHVKKIGSFSYLKSNKVLRKGFETHGNTTADSRDIVVVSSILTEEIRSLVQSGRFCTDVEVLDTSEGADVLKLPNVKLFIGDGNIFETILALQNNVPILSISANKWQQRFLMDALVEIEIIPEITLKGAKELLLNRTVCSILMNYSSGLSLNLLPIAPQLQWNPMSEALPWITYAMSRLPLNTNDLQGTMRHRLISIIIVLVVIDVVLFLLFYWFFHHFGRLMHWCTSKAVVRLEKSIGRKRRVCSGYHKIEKC